MGAKWKHLKTVLKHKWIVFRECKACGYLWQGIIHDLSKLGLVEFASSAKYFQGNRSPIDYEKECCGYSLAWLHHKGCNPHHWEYWTDFDSEGNIIANKIPYKYVVEMVCDWISAGMVYSGGNWTQSDTLDYYYKVRDGRHFHKDTEKLLVELLETIRDSGLDGFHKKVRMMKGRGY